MQLHTVYTRPGTATCTRCAGPYTHGTMLIVTGQRGGGEHLCPPCARHTGAPGRRLADLAAAELRATPARSRHHQPTPSWSWLPDDLPTPTVTGRITRPRSTRPPVFW